MRKLRWNSEWSNPESLGQLTSRRADGSYYVINMEYADAVSLQFVDLPRISRKDILKALANDHEMIAVNPGCDRLPDFQACSVTLLRTTKNGKWGDKGALWKPTKKFIGNSVKAAKEAAEKHNRKHRVRTVLSLVAQKRSAASIVPRVED